MALAAVPFIPADGALVFSDAAASPLSFTVPYEDGDLQFGEVMHSQKEVQAFLARGRFYSAREVEDVIPTFTFNAHLVGFTDATSATLLDIVRRAGTWAAATATLPSTAGGLVTGGARGVWTMQMKWTGERTDFGGTADSTLTLKYCRIRASFSEGVPGKITISGQALPYSTDYMAWT